LKLVHPCVPTQAPVAMVGQWVAVQVQGDEYAGDKGVGSIMAHSFRGWLAE
jgi:hypothetical protein